MKWVTRARPIIDRLACPWLIQRFIDPDAEFLFVAPRLVLGVARRQHATPYDVPGVELTHVGELCSFDAFITKYDLVDIALGRLARIVRGADTDRVDLAPECAGLLAVSIGLGRLHTDDHRLLVQAFPVYDALYEWCSVPPERLAWTPAS